MIIVGVDSSAPSHAALLWAARRASDLDIDLALLTVTSSRDDDRSDALLAEASREVREHHPELRVTTLTERGSVAAALVDAATYPDMIVIGTHKTGYIRGRLLGTLSTDIALSAHCPVAVIPDAFLATRQGVIVGTYDDAPWKVAVEAAASESVRLEQDLTIIFAGEDDADHNHSRDVLAMAARQARDAQPGLTITRRAAPRRPSEGLLDAARGAALLVLECRGERPQTGVVQEVLFNATSPVLVAR